MVPHPKPIPQDDSAAEERFFFLIGTVDFELL